jgi:protein-disulfide isomerase
MTVHARYLSLFILLLIGALVSCGGEATSSSRSGGEDSTIVAYVGDEAVTMAELETEAAGGLGQIDQQRYDLLSNTLSSMTTRMLVEREAEARGVTAEDLMESEVRSRVVPPSEDEILQFYEANKANMRGNPTLEQVRPQLVNYLQGRQATTLRNEFVESLKSETPIRLLLDPPRTDVEVTDYMPSKGPNEAPVTIVEFADFECPACRNAHSTLERVLAEYGDQVRFVFRDFPLNIHPRAIPASQAAHCAGDQEKFWDYYESLMLMAGDLSDEDLTKRAGEIGLNVDEFVSCFDAKTHADVVQAAYDQGRLLGVSSTPTFFINGRMMRGLRYETMKEVIDDELSRAAG